MYIGVLPARMSVHTCVPGAGKAQERMSDPLDLDVQIVVSCCVSAGN